MHQIDMPMHYHVWGAMPTLDQRYMPKLINVAQQKAALLLIWNDLLQEFIDIKEIASFHNRFQLCVAAAGGHSEHSV